MKEILIFISGCLLGEFGGFLTAALCIAAGKENKTKE